MRGGVVKDKGMDTFADYLQRMGGLHDAVVRSVLWSPLERTIAFRFDDIYSNFEGLPEYPGPEANSIVLNGIGHISFSFEGDEPLRVYEFLSKSDDRNSARISFWPSGHIEMEFERAEYPECRLLNRPV